MIDLEQEMKNQQKKIDLCLQNFSKLEIEKKLDASKFKIYQKEIESLRRENYKLLNQPPTIIERVVEIPIQVPVEIIREVEVERSDISMENQRRLIRDYEERLMIFAEEIERLNEIIMKNKPLDSDNAMRN